MRSESFCSLCGKLHPSSPSALSTDIEQLCTCEHPAPYARFYPEEAYEAEEKLPRRFVLTYEHGNQATDIEGVQFTSGRVALDHHPYGGIASFRDISHLERELNEFDTTSIKWIDEEVTL